MQTERITFLTSREHKAALDDFASRSGQSVGNLVREATRRYIAQPREESTEEAELAALVEQVNETLPKMNAAIDEMIEAMRTTHDEVDRSLRAAGIRK
jgi:metal-responsive CopG/Arc/MetJ family transcriptional regulator